MAQIGEGNGTPLQYSCLENPMDGGAWWAAVHGVSKSWTRLSDFTFTYHFHALKKEMATHSSVLAWRIPGMGEPGGLPSMESHRVGHDWSNLAAAAAAVAQMVKYYNRFYENIIFLMKKIVLILQTNGKEKIFPLLINGNPYHSAIHLVAWRRTQESTLTPSFPSSTLHACTHNTHTHPVSNIGKPCQFYF